MLRLRYTLLLCGVASLAHAHDRPPPEGVIAPPYERPVKRPMLQAALIVQGTVQSIHLQPSTVIPIATMTWQDGEWKPAGNEELPLTEAYKAYVADRFAGYPDPDWMGRWGFQMLRVEVEEVIASEADIDVRAGELVDLYVPSNFAIRSPRLVAFAERYVLRQEGTVSPWSEAGKAFVLPEMDISSTLVYEADKTHDCPGAATTRGGYVLRIAPSQKELSELAGRVATDLRGDDRDRVSSRHLGGVAGLLAGVPSFDLEGTPWSCDDLLVFDSVGAHTREAR